MKTATFVNILAKWISNKIENVCSLIQNGTDVYLFTSVYTYMVRLDDDFQIAIGFSDGYSPLDNDKYIICPNDVKEALIHHDSCHALSIMICSNDSAKAYEDMCMPYYRDNGNTYDTDRVIAYQPNGNYKELAKTLVKEYKELRKLFDKKIIAF